MLNASVLINTFLLLVDQQVLNIIKIFKFYLTTFRSK